jgi:hypothetical protein
MPSHKDTTRIHLLQLIPHLLIIGVLRFVRGSYKYRIILMASTPGIRQPQAWGPAPLNRHHVSSVARCSPIRSSSVDMWLRLFVLKQKNAPRVTYESFSSGDEFILCKQDFGFLSSVIYQSSIWEIRGSRSVDCTKSRVLRTDPQLFIHVPVIASASVFHSRPS